MEDSKKALLPSSIFHLPSSLHSCPLVSLRGQSLSWRLGALAAHFFFRLRNPDLNLHNRVAQCLTDKKVSMPSQHWH
jgi:hypothetical protein